VPERPLVRYLFFEENCQFFAVFETTRPNSSLILIFLFPQEEPGNGSYLNQKDLKTGTSGY